MTMMRRTGLYTMGAAPGAGAPAPVPGANVLNLLGRLKTGDILQDEFFQYVQTLAFVANETQTKAIQIQADAHFVCVSSYMNTSAATGAGTFQGAGVDRGGSVIVIKDGGSTRDLSNAPVPSDTLFGSAQRPFIWPFRKLFKANTSIILTVTGTTGAAQTIDFVFGGFKIPLSSLPPQGI